MMRLTILLLVCCPAALAAPQVFAEDLPTPGALGLMEGLLDSCSKADPRSAADFETQRAGLVQGVSEKNLAALRAASDYKTAYREFRGRLVGASQEEAAQACKVFLGRAAAPAS